MDLLTHSLLLILFCFSLSYSDNTSLVYKSCADETFLMSSTKSHSQALSSLFQELVSRSSESKFFKTSEGSDDGQAAFFGLFQCREDLSNQACRDCVRALPDMSSSLCKEAASGRVQLQGCYLRYEPDGVLGKYHESEMLHKTCGEQSEGIGGFEQMRDAAFSALEGEMENSNGFCKTGYELVQATAQCEGGIEACECGECVNQAVRFAQEECGSAFSGEIYMDKCFLSYVYYPQGIPGNLNPGMNFSNLVILLELSDCVRFSNTKLTFVLGERESKNGNGINGKTVAIVLGGAAALCFGFIFLMVIKSWTKKDDD